MLVLLFLLFLCWMIEQSYTIRTDKWLGWWYSGYCNGVSGPRNRVDGF